MPDIAFWNSCDNKCVMCTNMESFTRQDSAQYRLKGQIRKMESYLRGGAVYPKKAGEADFISLTGGEPTLHPDFFELVSYFRRRLPRMPITLLSNGRRFADAVFSARFLKAARPPFAVGIPLHGPDARTHDAITGVRGSFGQTMAGLRNLLAMRSGQCVDLRLVLHKKNISVFPRILKFLRKEFPDTSAYRVVAIHYEIEGMSDRNHRALALKLSDSGAVLNSSRKLIKSFGDFQLYHFPLCLVGKALRPLCRVTLPPEDRVYPAAKCGRCALKKKCLGLMLEYQKRFGNAELKPVRKRGK